MAITISHKLIAGLRSLKYREEGSRSKRYVAFRGPSSKGKKGVEEKCFYVGRNGALRRGTTIANSITVPENLRNKIVEYGEQYLNQHPHGGDSPIINRTRR